MRRLARDEKIAHDERIGMEIILAALEAPIRQIAVNAGEEGGTVVNRVKEKKDSSFGYNAETDEYGDLLKWGIVDPTKVVRSEIQNASSVAAMILTTEAIVAELPKREAPAAGGGGMPHVDY